MRLLVIEIRYFFTAVQFFTRIPVPRWTGFSQEQLNASTRYFPAVGWCVGLTIATALYFILHVLPTNVAVLIAFAASALLTGAFHEDGFTDAVDGLGGAYDKTKALTIMKDSRIGSFGALGLILLIGIKWQSLVALPALELAIVYLLAQPWSRWLACVLIVTMDYVRDDESSKTKPLAQRMSHSSFFVATLFGAIAPICFIVWFTLTPTHHATGFTLMPVAGFLGAVILSILVTAYFAWRLKKRLGGYTGDALGATQQLAETACFVGYIAAQKIAWS